MRADRNLDPLLAVGHGGAAILIEIISPIVPVLAF